MFLTDVKLFDIVKKQFVYKLKAFISVFSSLVSIQVIGMILSMNGISNYYTSFNGQSLNVSIYNGNLIIIFTMIWAFISAIIMTTKAYRNDDFVFIANRLSSNISNMCFLLLASFVGGITAMLAGILLKVVMFFIVDEGNVMSTMISFQELLLGMIVSMLYVLLFASLGYLIGMLVQVSKWFAVIIPALFFGYAFLGINKDGEAPLIVEIFTFYAMESSFGFFLLKVILAVCIFLFGSMILSNKMEVRQ